MKNTAKVKGQARHSVGAAGALLAGAGIANTEQVQNLQALLESLGVSPELQTGIGALVAGAAFLLSWYDKTKRQGEGDPE